MRNLILVVVAGIALAEGVTSRGKPDRKLNIYLLEAQYTYPQAYVNVEIIDWKNFDYR